MHAIHTISHTPILISPYLFFSPSPLFPLALPSIYQPSTISSLFRHSVEVLFLSLQSHAELECFWWGRGLTAHVVLRASTRVASRATPLFFCPSGFKGYFGCFTGKICPAVLTQLSNHRPTVVSHSVAAEMRLCLGRWGGSSRKALVTGIFTSFSFLL